MHLLFTSIAVILLAVLYISHQYAKAISLLNYLVVGNIDLHFLEVAIYIINIIQQNKLDVYFYNDIRSEENILNGALIHDDKKQTNERINKYTCICYTSPYYRCCFVDNMDVIMVCTYNEKILL